MAGLLRAGERLILAALLAAAGCASTPPAPIETPFGDAQVRAAAEDYVQRQDAWQHQPGHSKVEEVGIRVNNRTRAPLSPGGVAQVFQEVLTGHGVTISDVRTSTYKLVVELTEQTLRSGSLRTTRHTITSSLYGPGPGGYGALLTAKSAREQTQEVE